MKEYKLDCKEDITDEQLIIVKKYWQFEDGGFSFSPTTIKSEFNLNQTELTKIISQNSFCVINMGCCEDCNVEQYQNITSQSGFKAAMKNKFGRCHNCDKKYWENVEESRRSQQELENSRKQENLYDRQYQDKWKYLNNEELEVFKKIIHWKERNLIFANVFKSNYAGVWTIVNKLEKKFLLYVHRGDDGSVISFEFNSDFNSLFYGNERGTINAKDGCDHTNTYNFNIPPNKFKRSANSPNYSKEFSLPVNVTFEKGVEYLVGAWVLTDGSIHIKFTPKDQIFQSKDRSVTEEENELMGSEPFYPFINESGVPFSPR